MARVLIMATILVALLVAGPASAGPGTPELSGSWGWMWGGSADSRVGKFRLDSTMNLGGVVSVPMGHLNWTELQYTWQGTAMTLDGLGTFQALTDMNVHHIQIVGLRAIQDGPVMPYVIGGIGTTVFDPAEGFVDIEGTRYSLDTSWKLSFVLGAGVKLWLGEAERVGLRLQFRTLPSL